MRMEALIRLTILPERFNSLAILHNHKTFTNSLDLTDIANSFCFVLLVR